MLGHESVAKGLEYIFERSKTFDQFQNLVSKIWVGQGHLSRDPTFCTPNTV